MNKHYETLGLKPSASQEEIKNTYHKISQKFHPDNNDGDEYFSEMFKNYKEAYEILTNQSQKADSVRDNQNNDLSHSADKPKDSSPKILKFESDKDFFEEGKSIRLSWKTTNVDKVIIKPFGTVENSGTKVFKLKNYDKETLSITLQATNNSLDETITKTIKLKNNVMEFDFATIQEDETEVPEKLQEKVEIPESVWEEPEVYANSFAPPLARARVKSSESFFSSDGRIRRSTYFVRSLLLGIVGLLIYSSIILTSNDEDLIAFISLILVVIAIAAWIQTIKRLHDLDQSGWLSLLQLIPLVNFIFGLYLLFSDGSRGQNEYGQDPKGRI